MTGEAIFPPDAQGADPFLPEGRVPVAKIPFDIPKVPDPDQLSIDELVVAEIEHLGGSVTIHLETDTAEVEVHELPIPKPRTQAPSDPRPPTQAGGTLTSLDQARLSRLIKDVGDEKENLRKGQRARIFPEFKVPSWLPKRHKNRQADIPGQTEAKAPPKPRLRDRFTSKTSDEYLYKKERRNRIARIGALAVVGIAVVGGLLAANNPFASDEPVNVQNLMPPSGSFLDNLPDYSHANSIQAGPSTTAAPTTTTTVVQAQVNVDGLETESYAITREQQNQLLLSQEFGSLVVYMSDPAHNETTLKRDANIVWRQQQAAHTSPVLDSLRSL